MYNRKTKDNKLKNIEMELFNVKTYSMKEK